MSGTPGSGGGAAATGADVQSAAILMDDWKAWVMKAAVHIHSGQRGDALASLSTASQKITSSKKTKQLQDALGILSANSAFIKAQEISVGAILPDLKNLVANAPLTQHNVILWANVAQVLHSSGCTKSSFDILWSIYTLLLDSVAKSPVLMGYVCVRLAQQHEAAMKMAPYEKVEEFIASVIGTMQSCMRCLRDQKTELSSIYALVLTLHALLLKWKTVVVSDVFQAGEVLGQYAGFHQRELGPLQGRVLTVEVHSQDHLLLLPLVGKCSPSRLSSRAVEVEINTAHYLDLYRMHSNSFWMVKNRSVDDAIAMFKGLGAQNPDLFAYAQMQAGRLLSQQNKFCSAFLAYEQCLQRLVGKEDTHPRRLAPVVYNVALCSLRMGHALQAFVHFQALLRLSPEHRNNPVTLLRLAETCVVQHRKAAQRVSLEGSRFKAKVVANALANGLAGRVVVKDLYAERNQKVLESSEEMTKNALDALKAQVGATGKLFVSEQPPVDGDSIATWGECSLPTAVAALSHACSILLAERRQSVRPSTVNSTVLATVLTNLVHVHLQLNSRRLALGYARMLRLLVRAPTPVMANLIAHAHHANHLYDEARRCLTDSAISPPVHPSGAVILEGKALDLGGRPEVAALEINALTAALCCGYFNRGDVEIALRKYPDLPVLADWMACVANAL